MTEPSIDDLGKIAEQRRAEAPSVVAPARLDWLEELTRTPPPAPDPREFEKRARMERYDELGKLRSRMPQFVRQAKIETLKSRIKALSLQRVAESWEPSQGTAVLLGESGQGKTCTAGVMVLRLLKDGFVSGGSKWELAKELRWYRAQELEAAVKSHPLGRGEPMDLRRAMTAKLLVLDDLGWEKDVKIMAEIFAARYENQSLITIVTSGRDIQQLHERYEEAVWRRIFTHRGKSSVVARAFPEAEAAKASEDSRRRAEGVGVSKPPTEVG